MRASKAMRLRALIEALAEYPDDGRLWMGWDAAGVDVISDMNIHAILVEPALPSAIPTEYDYLYSDNPSDNSAYSLAEFAGICVNKAYKTYFNVGDKIKIVPHTEVFADSEIVMRVIGYNHYKLSDGSGEFAGVVFEMVGVMHSSMPIHNAITNVGGWPITTLRSYFNDTVYPELPQNWKALIKEVEVISTSGNSSTDIVSCNDKLFSLCAAEMYAEAAITVPYEFEVDPDADEITFSVYTDRNSCVKKTFNGKGSAVEYWLRSPRSVSQTKFVYVPTKGTETYSKEEFFYKGNTISQYVCFAFCM